MTTLPPNEKNAFGGSVAGSLKGLLPGSPCTVVSAEIMSFYLKVVKIGFMLV